MGFGTEMVGKTSHDAILRVQDAEIRLLETIHHFVSMRVENDRKYASGMTKMLHACIKGESSEFKECCNVFKAWDVILKETESLVRTLKNKSDHLSSDTLDILAQLIQEKRAVRKKYLEERQRLDAEFSKVQDEVAVNKSDYFKCMERLQMDKAKIMDMQAKGKGGQKVDEAKSKYFRSVVRLHKLHNDYILSVKAAKEHQTLLRDTTLPALLDCHQDSLECITNKTKYVLNDFLQHTDLCSSEFQEVTSNMRAAVNQITPGDEYSTSFLHLHRSSNTSPFEFDFDKHLLDDYSGSLKPDVIELNQLTVENLQQKLTKLNEEMEHIKNKITICSEEQQRLSLDVSLLTGKLSEEWNITNINFYLEKKSQYESYSRDLLENEGIVKKLESLVAVVKGPLTQLGDKQPPMSTDIQDFESANADTVSISTTSSAASSATIKDTTFIKSLSKMNPFKKGQSKNAHGANSSADEDNLSRMSNEDNGGSDETALRKRSHVSGYEKSELFLKNSNGQERASMMKMMEHGELLEINESEAKDRIADEEWFHGVLPREEVQRLLVSDGDYLVRESKNKKTNETQFVLSVYWQGHRHFIIQFVPERGWHFEGQAYPSIQELVHQQYDSGMPVTSKSGAILKKSILREWELLNDDIELKMKIGTGNFGEVYKGVYKSSQEVAVKTCKDTLTEEQKIKFLQEGRILKQYKHPNIVRYIGIAAQKQPVMIVMEFIPKGALLQYLKGHGSSQSVHQFVQMCVDASSGMEYLESRGCIHRDLAARNCLVGDKNIIKISDFGMSREEVEYVVSTGMKQIPVKWTAPEALNYGKYTTSCDVWSFGILMWEIFSCGRPPYHGMTNARARDWIEDGNRLDAPPGTPSAAYDLMHKCWEYKSDNRPHFASIHTTLIKIQKTL